MDETERQKKLEELLELFRQDKLMHDIKEWPGLAEREQKIMEKVAEREKKMNNKVRRVLIVSVGATLVFFVLSMYFLISKKEEKISYTILPGNVKEVALPHGSIIVNGNTQIEVDDNDSVMVLSHGEIFIKKHDTKESITVKTPGNSVVIMTGNANIVSLDQHQRITSLGLVKVINEKDTTNLPYGNELRTDSSKTYVRILQSPEMVGTLAKGRKTFENDKLSYILAQVASRYAIQLEVDYKQLPNQTMTVIVDYNEDPQVAISKILPQGWTVSKGKDRTYVINKQINKVE